MKLCVQVALRVCVVLQVQVVLQVKRKGPHESVVTLHKQQLRGFASLSMCMRCSGWTATEIYNNENDNKYPVYIQIV